MTASAARQFAVKVVQKLRSSGYEALWAGGCVRDQLLGIEPSDFDVATSATPRQVQTLFGHTRTLPVGLSFGVVIVLGEEKAAGQIEVATFRTDAEYSDGRRPDSVVFSTPEEDAHRRDFTINGMFYDPISDQLIDFVNGQKDLQCKVVRAIGNAHDRIAEDKLRMLRAVRFAARFGFEVDESTLAAVSYHAAELNAVSGERIAVEMRKTLSTNHVSWAIQTWYKTKLMRVFLPEISSGWIENSQVALKLLGEMHDADWLARFSAVLWATCKIDNFDTTLAHLRTRLKLSNNELDTISFAVRAQQVLAEAHNRPFSETQPVVTNKNIYCALSVLEARAAVSTSTQDAVSWITAALARPKEELSPAPLIGGADLKQLGMKPGPNFRKILAQARARQLDGLLDNRQSAIEWVEAQRSTE